MKKFFFTVIAVLSGTAAMAQGGSVAVNIGYGLGTPSEVLGTDSQPGNETNIYGTYGSGLNFGITPGYMLTEHFGMEIGLNYFMGTEVMNGKYTNSDGTYESYVKSNQFRILPNLVVSSGGDVMSVYAKVGLVLPVTGTTFSRAEDSGAGALSGFGTAATFKAETKGQFSLGYSGAIGGNYNLSDNLSLFAELSGNYLRIKGKSTSYTEYTVAGQDVLGVMPTYMKEIEYEDEVNPLLDPSDTPSAARKELAPKNNYSAIFLNIGIKFNF